MFAAAIVAAQSLLAVGILIPAYAVSAFLCGPIIGLLMRLRMRQRMFPPVAHAGEESCGGSETRLGFACANVFRGCDPARRRGARTALVWGYWSESERQRERSVEIDRVATAAGLVGNHSTCLVGDGIELSFRGHHVDDAKLQHLAGLPLIIALDLSDTQITDAGLPAIADLTRLDYLQLGNTAITDRGLECLSRLKNLQALDLAGTRVTQAGAKFLERLPKLRVVYARGTGLTRLSGIHLDTTHGSRAWGGDLGFLRGLDRYRGTRSYKKWNFDDPAGFGEN